MNTNKKTLAVLLLLVTFSLRSTAQELRLNGYSAYAFNDNLYYANTDATLKGGFLYGAGLEYKLGPLYGAELMYQRLDSKLPIRYTDRSGTQIATFDYNLNYIMFASNNYLPFGRIEPYGSLLLGLAVLDIKSPLVDPMTKFTWGLRIGTNIALTPKVFLKLQAQYMSVVESVSSSLNFSFSGISPGINTHSSINQFNLGGGLVFNLSKN